MAEGSGRLRSERPGGGGDHAGANGGVLRQLAEAATLQRSPETDRQRHLSELTVFGPESPRESLPERLRLEARLPPVRPSQRDSGVGDISTS